MTTTHQIVCIGDVHKRSGHFRDAAYLAAFDSIIDYGFSLPNLALWLQAGDLFDQRSSVDDRNQIAERFQRMASRAPVVCVEGNHGIPGDTSILSRLSADWTIEVVTSAGTLLVKLPTGAIAAVACLPYPARAGLIAAGTNAGETLQAGGEILGDVLQGLAMELRRAEEAGYLPLFLAHINVAGAALSNAQPSIGREIEVSREALRVLGSCPKVLGHIHKPQQFDDVNAYYCGSIAPCNFGELEDKRFLVVEYSAERALRSTVISVPIDTPKLYHVDATWSRDGFTYRVAAGPDGATEQAPASWTGAEVRVRYTFPASERAIVTDDEIRRWFADAARLDLEPVAIPDRGLRAPEVAAAHTLAEKLSAWCAFGGFDKPTDSLLAKLASLEHLDGQAVLSGVSDQVAAIEHGQAAEEGAAA